MPVFHLPIIVTVRALITFIDQLLCYDMQGQITEWLNGAIVKSHVLKVQSVMKIHEWMSAIRCHVDKE